CLSGAAVVEGWTSCTRPRRRRAVRARGILRRRQDHVAHTPFGQMTGCRGTLPARRTSVVVGRRMLTPRSTLNRRLIAALDASPSRIPVLLGGCGTGRTTLLHQLRERLGRTSAQYIDVERTATTPERFMRAIAATSPFPVSDNGPGGAR